MALNAKNHFILVSSFTHDIHIGDILTDAFRPEKVLSNAASDIAAFSKLDSVIVPNHTLVIQPPAAQTFHNNLLFKFGLLGRTEDSRVAVTYRIKELETVTCAVGMEDIRPVLQNQVVMARIMGKDNFFRRKHSVYLITGMKVAKGIQVLDAERNETDGDVMTGEVVVAYRVSKIGVGVGRDDGNVGIELFTPAKLDVKMFWAPGLTTIIAPKKRGA